MKACAGTLGLFGVAMLAVSIPRCPSPTPQGDAVPAPNPFFEVPVRWCVVEGSPALGPGVATDAVLNARLAGATSNIYNIPTNNTMVGLTSHPVNSPVNPVQRIADPCPPGPTCPGELGNVLDEGYFMSPEEQNVITACRTAWRTNMPENTGIIAINVRRFVQRNGQQAPVMGLTEMPYACNPLLSADICRNLTLANPALANLGAGAAVILTDNSIRPLSDDFLVAHEFGHALGLGHGDGIDNNGNGVFDECCDASESESGRSLMSAGNGSLTITELQKNAMRAIAFVTPGTRFLTLAERARAPVVTPERVASLPPGFDKVISPPFDKVLSPRDRQ